MKYFKSLLCSLILMLIVMRLSAQAPYTDVYKVIKSNTGQSYLLAQANTGGTLYTDIYFRIGTVYELDSVSGISVMITKIMDRRINAAIKGRNIKYYSTTDPEQLGFHFESTAADLDFILALVHDNIMTTKFDDESVNDAKSGVRSDLAELQQKEGRRTDNKIKKYLWGKDYVKLNVYGDKVNYTRIAARQFNTFQYKFFLPLNNMVVLTGSFNEQEVTTKLESAFRDFRTKEFNPELIRKVIEFKPVINTIQVVSAGSDTPVASVIYQNPGARQDRSATYCAFILTQLINDPNGRIAGTFRGTGLSNVKANFECNNFEGTLTITAKLTTKDYNKAFSRLDSLVSSFTRKDYFSATELETASKAITAEFGVFRSHTHDFMTQVARYRFSNDENYFPSLADSIQKVSVSDMQRYVGDYFVDHAGVKCLYANIDPAASDSATKRFYALDESIKDIKFNYELNKTDIETDSAKQDLQRLIQWLTINPDMHIQINGFSDHGEFTKSFDTTVTNFIRATPTFRKAMPDAIKVGYLRIEMMRAMKIAKALYEAGIGEDRISGTSMVFNSDTPEGAAANRKCTVTLEKIKPRLSLYEYHFGKKKEEDTPAK